MFSVATTVSWRSLHGWEMLVTNAKVDTESLTGTVCCSVLPSSSDYCRRTNATLVECPSLSSDLLSIFSEELITNKATAEQIWATMENFFLQHSVLQDRDSDELGGRVNSDPEARCAAST